MLKLVRPSWWMRAYYPEMVWSLPDEERAVYLTFDDGPTPGVTEWVLDLLKQYDAQGTFFLIGKNCVKHPELVREIKAAGHSIGNHTFDHLNGWKNNTEEYLKSFSRFSTLHETALFRPPYGRITKRQVQVIKQTHRIVMWDIITNDFDVDTSPEQCFEYVKKYVRPGSVIVFHDSLKAWPNLSEALPQTLEYLSSQDFQMKAISSKETSQLKSAHAL